jgi:DNA-binding HxlR family transcriptional regulator
LVREASAQGNSISATLGLIGDEWNLLIIRHAIAGARRYNDWRDRLGIANSVLTARLKRLTSIGVFERVAYQDRPVRHEYLLTALGREVWRILLVIWAWELHWVPSQRASLERMRHGACGRRFEPLMACRSCGKTADVHDVTGVFGPSGSYARSVPSEKTRRRSAPSDTQGPGLFPETVSLIGNRWSAALLASAFQGAHRFTEFESRLSAPPTIVADRLRTFCSLGVLEPVVADDRADRNLYHLTDKGRAFFPVIMVAVDWGERWFPAPEGPAMYFTHTACGLPFAPLLVCSCCGDELRGRDVIVEPPGRRRRR